MTHLISFKFKYPGSTTGFCVGLLLNLKYPGSTTGFCVGLLFKLKYPGSPTGFCVAQSEVPWFTHGALCGSVAQSFIFCVVVYRPLFIFLFGCLSLYCYVTARRGHDRMVVGFTTTYAISAYHHWCLWVRNSIRARCTTWCDEVCQWLATDRWFSLGPPVSSTNKTDRHDIAEMLLNTIKQTYCYDT